MPSDPAREMLRHTLATLAYRGAKALRGAPASFADFAAGEGARTPVAILAHIGDLFDWAITLADGNQAWNGAEPLPWDQEVERFFAGLEKFDRRIADDRPLHATVEGLFQGPVADALTHVGQLSLLRRMASAPVKAENYYRAEIIAGRVGASQTAPRREF